MDKKRDKIWIALFLVTALVIAFAIPVFNYVTDPFGAFGDRFFQWWSFDMTENPRVAKISYLDQNHDKYDSYVLGSSSSSSFPAEALNKYFDAKFFNMIMYGSDMLDVEQTAEYLLNNYEVKNIVLSVHAHDAMQYDLNTGKLMDLMHYKADGSDKLSFLKTYLFADWHYGWNKIKSYSEDSFLQKSYDVFTAETGAYDKSLRDVEPIGTLEDYVAKDAYKIFADYPSRTYNVGCLDKCMESVARIKELCSEKGAKLTVICPPMYADYLDFYTDEMLCEFAEKLASVCDFWDFTKSSASFEPRYFYDETHFRNTLGNMALAKIAGDTSVWMPEDFGYHMTAENVDTQISEELALKAAPQETYTDKVPILMYHETFEQQGEEGITLGLFESHMKALKNAGYTAIDFKALKDYVEKGTPLPQKPVIITFDDGYSCNLIDAGKILEKYGMKATIFAIGCSVGKDSYKDTGVSMNPHFSAAEGAAAIEKGLFDVQSHGFNMHEVSGLDPDPVRYGILQKAGESEAEYVAFIRSDCEKMKDILGSMGSGLGVMAYPFGVYNDISEVVMAGEGVYASVSTKAHMNTVIKGLPQSLRCLGRFGMAKDISAEEMLRMIEE